MKLWTLLFCLTTCFFLSGEEKLIYSIQCPNLKVFWDTDEKKFFALLNRDLFEPAYWEWTPDNENFDRGAATFVSTAQFLCPGIQDFSDTLKSLGHILKNRYN